MAGGYEQVLESENVDPKLLGQRNTEDHATLHAQVNINVLIIIAFEFFDSNTLLKINRMLMIEYLTIHLVLSYQINKVGTGNQETI